MHTKKAGALFFEKKRPGVKSAIFGFPWGKMHLRCGKCTVKGKIFPIRIRVLVYDDAVSQGRNEEDAFEEVAASLEDVQGLLEEMNRMEDRAEQDETEPPELKTGTEETGQPASHADLGDALNKAFAALGDFSQAVVPEARKLVREMDGAAGGMFSRLGRAAKKGMRDAQKAAGSAIDRLSKEHGELVFDFGAKKQEEADAEESARDEADVDFAVRVEEDVQTDQMQRDAETIRDQAQDLRAQAALKAACGDNEGAQTLYDMAEELENCASALEQTAAVQETSDHEADV